MSALVRTTDSSRTSGHVRNVPILLQNPKVATVRIFGETLEREVIGDSHNLTRVAEIAYVFSAKR